MEIKSRSVYKGVILFYFITVCSCTLSSQCLSSSKVWMDSISSIETGTTYSIPDKLKQLLQLKQLYIKCRGTKDSIYARILHRLGDYYTQEGNFEKGISFTKEAITINCSGKPGAQKSYLCNSVFNLGYYYNQLNDTRRSIAYYDSCVQLCKYYPAKNFIALRAFEKLSYSYSDLGDYEKCIEIAEQGILFSKQTSLLLKAPLFLQIAQSQIELDRTEEAEKNIRKVLDSMPVSDINLPNGYTIYARFFKRIKNFKASIEYDMKAFDLNKKRENWIQCSNCLISLGLCYEDLNNPQKAIDYYNEAIQILKTKDEYQLTRIYNNMGNLYWKRKEYLKALQYFQKGLNTVPIHFKDSSVKSNPSVFMLKFASNNYYVYLLLANKGESFLGLYKEKKEKKILDYALKTFRIADQMARQMRQLGSQSNLFWREKTKKMYEQAIETCYLLDDMESAFFFFEKSRAALLNDKLNELSAKKYLTQQEQDREDLLGLRLFALQQKLINEVESSPAYDRLKQQWFTVQNSLEKLIKNIEHSNPVYYQYKYDTTVYTVQDVRSKLLQKDQSLIEYFNGDSSMYAFIITPDKAILKQINFKDYDTVLNSLLTLCSNKSVLNRDYNRYRQLSNKIYTYLYKPLSISTKRVIISPDGNFIPFDLLLKDPADDNSFLLKEHAFSYTYSAAFLIKNQKKQLPENNTFLGVAPVNYQSGLKKQTLYNSEYSLAKIEPYFSSSTLLINENATKKEFLSNLSSYTIVQLYTHADASNTCNDPLIYFSDSSLKVSELQFLRDNITTRLMILSACNTAVGINMKGEGVFSFARGIAAAGIPSTIATLWQVDNQTTYQITELFYKYLSEGIPGDLALQKAKMEFLSTNDVTKQLPYFWAANILIGETNIINKKPFSIAANMYFVPIILFILLVVSAIGLQLRKRK